MVMHVQSILIHKKVGNKNISMTEAKKILSKFGGHYIKVDITDQYYRFRQIEPKLFKKSTFRTKKINKFIKIIVGYFK